MPRIKHAKRAKGRQTLNNVLSNVQKMEKDLLKAPAKLALQLTKQIKVLKKQETKLNKAVSQIKNQLVKAGSRLQAAEQDKKLHGSKKPFKLAKRDYAEIDRAHKQLSTQLSATEKSLESHLNTQVKLTALSKYLDGFGKNWMDQTKTPTKPSVSIEKNKKKTKRKIKNDPSVVQTTTPDQAAESVATHDVIDEVVS